MAITAELFPRSILTSQKWWDLLTPHTQRKVLLESQALTEAMVDLGMSRLRVGEHLWNIREELEPMRVFTKYLGLFKTFRKTAAYEYINHYADVKKKLPDNLVRTALAKGYELRDLQVMDQHPPPRMMNTQQQVKYLEHVTQLAKEQRRLPAQATAAEPPTYEVLLEEAVAYCARRLAQVDADEAENWVRQLALRLLAG